MFHKVCISKVASVSSKSRIAIATETERDSDPKLDLHLLLSLVRTCAHTVPRTAGSVWLIHTYKHIHTYILFKMQKNQIGADHASRFGYYELESRTV